MNFFIPLEDSSNSFGSFNPPKRRSGPNIRPIPALCRKLNFESDQTQEDNEREVAKFLRRWKLKCDVMLKYGCQRGGIFIKKTSVFENFPQKKQQTSTLILNRSVTSQNPPHHLEAVQKKFSEGLRTSTSFFNDSLARKIDKTETFAYFNRRIPDCGSLCIVPKDGSDGIRKEFFSSLPIENLAKDSSSASYRRIVAWQLEPRDKRKQPRATGDSCYKQNKQLITFLLNFNFDILLQKLFRRESAVVIAQTLDHRCFLREQWWK